MKIANIDFPDIKEGGFMFMPRDTEEGWECGFALILHNTKTGKVKFTNFRLIDFTSLDGDLDVSIKWPESFSNEEEKELLRIAFLLNEAQEVVSGKISRHQCLACDRPPWPQGEREGEGGQTIEEGKSPGRSRAHNHGFYGSCALFHAATREDYLQLNALSNGNKQKLIDNGYYDREKVTFDEAIEFLHNLKVTEAENRRLYRFDEEIEWED